MEKLAPSLLSAAWMPSRCWAPPAQHQAKNWAKSGQTDIFWVDISHILSYVLQIILYVLFLFHHILSFSFCITLFILPWEVHLCGFWPGRLWKGKTWKTTEVAWFDIDLDRFWSILRIARAPFGNKNPVQTPISLNGSLNIFVLVLWHQTMSSWST